MANTREIIHRRRSVSNIRKITKTMEMIATAKFKRTYAKAAGSKPYTDTITAWVNQLAHHYPDCDHPLLRDNPQARRTVLLVLSANRGLCGGYNANLLRRAQQEYEQLSRDRIRIDLRVSGKKGISFFRFMGYDPVKTYTRFDDKMTYAVAENLADELMHMYTNRTVRQVRVVYTHFVSSSQFEPHALTLLPLPKPQTLADETTATNEFTLPDPCFFSPEPETILRELIPLTVRSRLYQCLTDTVVTEQIARMRAMKAATDNSESMIKSLTQQYNRLRQSQITSDMLDIVGGAEALSS